MRSGRQYRSIVLARFLFLSACARGRPTSCCRVPNWRSAPSSSLFPVSQKACSSCQRLPIRRNNRTNRSKTKKNRLASQSRTLLKAPGGKAHDPIFYFQSKRPIRQRVALMLEETGLGLPVDPGRYQHGRTAYMPAFSRYQSETVRVPAIVDLGRAGRQGKGAPCSISQRQSCSISAKRRGV